MIKVIEKEDRKLKFNITCDMGFANALRRVLMNEVPVLSIETVSFEKNTSGMFDEILAHRLGLVPLKFDRKLMTKKGSLSQVTFSLEKTGPCNVTAGDLISKSGEEAVDKETPLVSLEENQELKFDAVAELGVGKEHSKWQSSVVGYKQEKDGYTFEVESVCGLTAKELVESALDVIEEKATEFEAAFKKAMK
ncbi:DNA-directed RNA polymerase subunit D [Candidatus Aenigmatarchaeota archaeon]